MCVRVRTRIKYNDKNWHDKRDLRDTTHQEDANVVCVVKHKKNNIIISDKKIERISVREGIV